MHPSIWTFEVFYNKLVVQVYARLAFLFNFIVFFIFKETHITPNVDGIETGAT